MENLITVVTLVWVIYSFLFIEADRELAELLRRVKFAIAINKSGVLDLNDFNAKQHLSAIEVIELGEIVQDIQFKAKIQKFKEKYSCVGIIKKISAINLLLLSGFVTLDFFTHPNKCFIAWIKIHIVLSIFFSLIFYFIISNLSKQKLIQFSIKSD
ncbi:MAG: hypothetical protein U1F57_05355 [bacterium]